MKNKFVSVCIATYNRSELLTKLIDSLTKQKINGNIDFEIIVVDNDPSGSAKFIIDDFKNTKNLNVKYYIQPIKNISLTRNKGIENSKGDYILFIDDDEIAAPEWIQSMVDTIQKYGADAAFGRVMSHFDDGTPDWISKHPLFNREAPPTGTEALFTRTGNCIIKSSLLKDMPVPFDPEYGITGGSDTHLFGKLKKQGAKFVNCFEGWISEYVPPQRANAAYILKTWYSRGNNFTRRYMELGRNKKSVRFIKSVSVSLIYCLISVLLTIIVLPSKYWRLYWASKIASNLGHLSAAFGYYDQQYK
ncbi:MAG: glycosyltransferase family 2 protein [Ignavibacteriaceae bacterium]